jgi:FkbM family methyltransferase
MIQLDINEKQKTSYCISTELRDQQILINLKKVKGRVEPVETLTDEPIALVSFGPSLKDTWEKIKDFKYIMTCSGAYKFLVDKGIIPTHHLELEPRPHKVKMLGQPHHETEFLIASTIHPNYIDALEGYNVKLWHIFATDEEAVRVLPKGEWSLSGGSSVGLRTMTMARFLGFTNLHIFGMDGNVKSMEETHSTKHPNAPDKLAEVEYEGKIYLTTPSMLHVAKETFHELDQMADVKATFYGEGLVQDMAKNYKPNLRKGTLIAFNSPELISKEYVELNHKLHQDNPTYGMGGSKYAKTVIDLTKSLITPTNQFVKVLDYGCGKGMLAKSLPFSIEQYDPAIPEYSTIPAPADIVVCTDVLEHIEEDKLMYVLQDLKRVTKQIGYFVISTRKAVKTYSNGKNAHLIVQGKDWWEKKLKKFFDIGTIIDKEKECELHIVVAPKKEIKPDMTEVAGVRFYTPNETTKWRAETLLTKEPSTIDWINSMSTGDILFDVGANIGSYSVLAGSKGVKVFAFEPEAENYALLIKNLQLNNIEPNAYCIALSDEDKIGMLHVNGNTVGGACNSFNEEIGFDLQEKKTNFSQGCFGVSVDSLIERGLPMPTHVKIDVDGLEYKVINGMSKILDNVKSILVEVNPSLKEHQDMLNLLEKKGFKFDQAQVDKVTRKDGPFKGCAEYIFTKQSKLEQFLVDKISNSILHTEPFPYFFVEDIFPQEIYDKMVENFPEEYVEIEKSRGLKGYPKRFTAKAWDEIEETLMNGGLKDAILERFNDGIAEQIEGDFAQDVLLIRDKKGYSIPPHTDTPKKVVSALFYLPKDFKHLTDGTNIYLPKEKGFTCKKGVHYTFDKFKKVKGFPYKPNALLVFLRTDNSFHGVAPSKGDRDVLLYNLRVKC